MNIQSFKNREIDTSKKVRVYRNLVRKGVVWSLKQDGLVVGHSQDIILKDAKSVISRSGQRRAVKEQERNVHAFVEGYISDVEIDIKNMYGITYNPFKNEEFVRRDNNMPVIDMGNVVFNEKGVFIG